MPPTTFSPSGPPRRFSHRGEPDLNHEKGLSMAKATHVNSTPRRTAPSRKTTPPARPDPIFAQIENHEKLDRAYFDLCRAREAGLAKEHDVDQAIDAAEKAAWKMARTKPSTAAGASALLTYITTGPVTGLFELGETRWHETAFRNVTASLARITQRAA